MIYQFENTFGRSGSPGGVLVFALSTQTSPEKRETPLPGFFAFDCGDFGRARSGRASTVSLQHRRAVVK